MESGAGDVSSDNIRCICSSTFDDGASIACDNWKTGSGGITLRASTSQRAAPTSAGAVGSANLVLSTGIVPLGSSRADKGLWKMLSASGWRNSRSISDGGKALASGASTAGLAAPPSIGAGSGARCRPPLRNRYVCRHRL